MTTEKENDHPCMGVYLASFLTLIGTIITAENILLVLTIFKSQIWSISYLFTTSLGVTDLIVGILVIIDALIHSPLGICGSWPDALTAFHFISSPGMVMLSVVHMALVAVERYVYIVHPYVYQKHLTPRLIKRVIATTWIVCLLVLLFVFLLHVYVVGVTSGTSDWSEITGILSATIYAAMTVVSLVCYTLIVSRVRKLKHIAVGTGNTIPRWREKAKSVKFFMMVFGVYFLMTFPTYALEAIEHVVAAPHELHYVMSKFAMFNSGMNFVILCIVDSKFREILKHQLKSICT